MSDMYYRLAITPLSPVHMGTDADYEPTNYVIDDGALYEFDAIAGMQALPDGERKRLDRILAGKPDDAMLRQVQAFFHVNRERLIPFSRRQVRVNPGVEAFYKERVGRVAQHEGGGRKVQNKLEIERAAWNPVSGHPLLPGSGLKGAIRTALLDMVNDSAPLPHRLRYPGARDGSNIDRNANSKLQEILFEGAFAQDPMRLIRIGDAALREGMQLPTEVMFALNRKKQPVQRDEVLVQSQAEQQGLYQLLECLPPFFDRPFEGSLSIQDLEKVGDERNTPTLRFSADDIVQACNRFYRPILQRELDLLRQRGLVDHDWAERMKSLLQQLQPAFEGGKAFLLRVGRHSGAESVTLNGVRSIRIMKGKGKQADWSDSPKTIWLAGHERQAQRNLLPFGWLLVEFEPEGPPLFNGAGEKGVLASWQRKVQARIDERCEAAERERLEREAQRRREQEAAARQAAELAERRAREEAERKAREAALEQMPPVQREVEAFDTVLDAIHALESNHWGDKQSEAARYLRERMQREGVWVEQSKKKKPEKDKPHQRTLLVLKYLA